MSGPLPLLLLLALATSVWGKKVEVKEVTFDSAVSDIQWLGDDQSTVLVLTSRGRLYRSGDKGASWNEITEKLREEGDSAGPSDAASAIAVAQIVKSKADPNTVLVAGQQRTHYISTDKGVKWRRLRQKSTIHTFLFHRKRPKWALMSTWTDACEPKKKKKADDDEPCNHKLYMTTDLGKTFQLVSSYVVQFSWGDMSQKQEDRIYFTHFTKRSGDQPKLTMWSKDVEFAYTSNNGRTVVPLVPMGNKFLISHRFIFVAKLKEQATQSVSLMVSSNGGSSFAPAKLPEEIDEKSYTVLDTSEGAVMLHVNHGSRDGGGFGVGNLYISDGDGLRYTLSLENNVRGGGGGCEFDKVLSLEGVYLANFRDTPGTSAGKPGQRASANKEAEELEEASASGTEVDKRRKSKAKSESVVRTVISFDKGGAWSYLKPPKVDSLGKPVECPPDRCWLHLHGVANFHNYAPFYSTENAVGIIMGTGNVGPYLRFEMDQTNTYMSRDGGLSWQEVHKGAYIYEYGDHGGLVLMADDIKRTSQVVFSWNEGQSWYDFELSKFPVEVDNIVTEPNATSTKFLLYGTRGDAGVLYYLDFEALGQPICKGVWAADSVSSDYETWMPSDGKGSDRCMLGRQLSYTRRKQTSECFNGEKFERPVTRKSCECKEENFECEMGFARKVDSLECRFVDDGSIPVPKSCTSSDFYHAPAHRKVIGDACEGGWQPSPQAVPCPAGSRLSKGAWSVLGTVGMVAVVMALLLFVGQSERFRDAFANSGFDSHRLVRYRPIGDQKLESAVDFGAPSGAVQFSDQDFDDDGGDGNLMSYTADPGESADRGRRSMDAAAASVPKLQRPPPGFVGSTAAAGEDLDLL